MQIPTHHLLTKFPVFNLNVGPMSANHEQHLEYRTFNTGTPGDGPQCTAGDPEARHPSKLQTKSSRSLMPLQDLQQLNYVTYNCKLQYAIYYFVTVHNLSVSLIWSNVYIHIKKIYCEITISTEIYRHWPANWQTAMSHFMCTVSNTNGMCAQVYLHMLGEREMYGWDISTLYSI